MKATDTKLIAKENVKPSKNTWRLIDTGLRSAAENIAINKSMLAAHQQGIIPNTLRFLRYTPTALLGFHQSARQELHLEYCRDNNIEIQRRLTGGGAIYFDTTQIGWELYFEKNYFNTVKMDEISRRICSTAARGISDLGVDATFRPRNDIEVDGRKISGTGGSFDGSSILYQGTLLIEFDVEKMLRILRIPIEKLSAKSIQSARDRVVNLSDLLGYTPTKEKVKTCMVAAFEREFMIEFETEHSFKPQEQELYKQALREIEHPDWINLIDTPQQTMPTTSIVYRCAGGTMRVTIIMDTVALRLKQIWITGDFFVSPKRAVVDLEAQLKNVSIKDVKRIVTNFLADQKIEFLQMSDVDVDAAIQAAIQAAQQKPIPEKAESTV